MPTEIPSASESTAINAREGLRWFLPLLGFFANLLVMGWSIGLLVAGMVLRYGLGAESFAWVSIFAIAPLSGIYYPVSTLPEWLQPVSWMLPSSYVFEGMRQLMFGQVLRSDLMWQAVGLNLAYLAAGTGIFLLAFHSARRNGLLLRVGE